ncbi:MAG: mechanosensitive ion channel family protein [Mediterranea sp.]|jgi:miniconductance mechanosensitive channel|nr:mechanosensitive ion channel family protein [Mediterranea sp.]
MNDFLKDGYDTLIGNIHDALLAMGMSAQWADIIDNFVILLIIVIVALLANLVCEKIILRGISKLVKRSRATWDDIVFNERVIARASRLVAPVIIYVAIPMAFPDAADQGLLDLLRRLCLIYITVVVIQLINSLLSAIHLVYSAKEKYKDKPLKGLFQTAQVILICLGIILVVSILLDKQVGALLAGLGASAAVLMLVFKDSIMGVVSGIQLTANNMLKVGDWITMPKYGADGTVIEVSLNTVKVQNFDNTIVTIPPYMLVSDSFQNWQGMQDSPGRRVKRSINIDMNSVHFCTPEMLAKFRRIHLLSDYVDSTEKTITAFNEGHHVDNSELVNGRRQTNLGVFRAYLVNYLNNLPTVNHDLTCMVRQLQPTATGIPVELYFFTLNKDWVIYEGIQADVFDHVLAIVPEFGLQIFQNLSGADLGKLKN